MQEYYYEAFQKDGKIISGSSESKNQMSLADKLHRDGLMVISISPANKYFKENITSDTSLRLLPSIIRRINDKITAVTLAQTKISLNTLLFFMTQLSSMVGSGLTLVSVVANLAEESDNKKLKMILRQVLESVKSGSSFSESITAFPKIFDPVFVSLTKAGEISGSLDKTLVEATKYMEKTVTIRQKIKQAMMYPCIILSLFFIIGFVLIAFIVPQFESLFARLGSDLPAPTKFLLLIHTLIIDNTIPTLLCLMIIGAAIFFTNKMERGGFFFDRLLFMVPLFGPLTKKAALAKIARTLSIMLDNGVVTTTALEQVLKISSNSVIQNAIKQSIDEIKAGKSLSEAFTECKVFPRLVIQMASSGEDSGSLPQMLEKVADHYEKQIEFQVNTLSTVIEPVLIVFLAVVIAGILFAMYLPIFKMGQAIRTM